MKVKEKTLRTKVKKRKKKVEVKQMKNLKWTQSRLNRMGLIVVERPENQNRITRKAREWPPPRYVLTLAVFPIHPICPVWRISSRWKYPNIVNTFFGSCDITSYIFYSTWFLWVVTNILKKTRLMNFLRYVQFMLFIKLLNLHVMPLFFTLNDIWK